MNLLKLTISLATTAAFCMAGCSSEGKPAKQEPPAPKAAVTPYTTTTHSLHGNVAQVTTMTFRPDSELVATETRSYNHKGQLTRQIVAPAGMAPDTMTISYDSLGRVTSDDPTHVRPVHDSSNRLIGIENYDSGPAEGSGAAREPSVVMVFAYDRSGRLIHEAMAQNGDMSSDGESRWIYTIDYEYSPHGLRCISRHNSDRSLNSVMSLDSAGAPAEEKVFDADGRCRRHHRYHVTGHDHHGNWTQAAVTSVSDSITDSVETPLHNLSRKITYHERP